MENERVLKDTTITDYYRPKTSISQIPANNILSQAASLGNRNEIESIRKISDYYRPKTSISQITANKKLLEEAYLGNWEGIESVLIRNADINYQDNEQGFTALHIIISNNNIKLVERLLKQPKINIYIKDYNGRNALDFAKFIDLSDFDNMQGIFAKDENSIQEFGPIVKLLLKHEESLSNTEKEKLKEQANNRFRMRDLRNEIRFKNMRNNYKNPIYNVILDPNLYDPINANLGGKSKRKSKRKTKQQKRKTKKQKRKTKKQK